MAEDLLQRLLSQNSVANTAALARLAALNPLNLLAEGADASSEGDKSSAETSEESALSFSRNNACSRRSSEWQPSPLTGLPLEALVEVACARLIRKAHAGSLTALDAQRLTSGDILHECKVLGAVDLEYRGPIMRVLRHVWTRDVAWALFTTEWVDSIVRLLHRIIVHGPAGEAQHASRTIRVVEVAAGSGLLATAMRAKGIDWSSSDSAKARDDRAHGCEQMTALETLVEIETSKAPSPDVVFWSWWSRNEAHEANAGGCISEERAVAEHCHRLNIPIVFVGEAAGGITGGSQYWKDAPWTTVRASDYVDEGALIDHERLGPFVDVCQWRGYNDCTWVQQRNAR